MRSLLAVICAVAVFTGAVGMAPRAEAFAAAKPWTDADHEAFDGFAARYLQPAEDAADRAFDLDWSHPAAACAGMKDAQAKAEDAQAAFRAFAGRLRDEGKDTRVLGDLGGQLMSLVLPMPYMVAGACQFDDPNDRSDAARFKRYFATYDAAQVVAAKARDAGARDASDRAQACRKVAEARAAMEEARALVADMRARYRSDNPTDLGALEQMVAERYDDAVKEGQGCPAL